MTTRRAILRSGGVMGGGLAGLLGTACGTPAGPGAAGQSSAPVTLELFHEWDGVRTKLVEDMCSDFHQLHPDITAKPTLSRGNISMDKIFATLVSGTPPDVVNIRTETGLVWANKTALRFLDDRTGARRACSASQVTSIRFSSCKKIFPVTRSASSCGHDNY